MNREGFCDGHEINFEESRAQHCSVVTQADECKRVACISNLSQSTVSRVKKRYAASQESSKGGDL